MVKPESGDVVQQWVLRIGDARTLLDKAATLVAATINDADRTKAAPSIVRETLNGLSCHSIYV